MAVHHTFITNATADTTSAHAEWVRGHITVFAEGTFGGNGDDDDDDSAKVVVEASADNGTTFVPIDGLDNIRKPMAKYWRITGHCHIRAKVIKGDEACNVTVRIV